MLQPTSTKIQSSFLVITAKAKFSGFSVLGWTAVSGSLTSSQLVRLLLSLIQTLLQFCIAVGPLLQGGPQAAIFLHVLLLHQLHISRRCKPQLPDLLTASNFKDG